MSLYNMMCGINPAASRLLKAIDLDPKSVPRFRDIWVDKNFTEVTVHTRTGGGNREAYTEQNALMSTHPLYLRDSDDSFDSTFADFVFRLPSEQKEMLLEELRVGMSHHDDAEKKREAVIRMITKTPREKFDEAMSSMRQKMN